MINSNNLRISLDRREPNSDVDFISHAHTDHLGAAKSSKMVLASDETIQLIEQSQNMTIQNKSNGCNFQLIEAGHMLGSRQLVANDDKTGKRITYTGDFQTVRSKTSKPIDVRETDVLIMDSTYEDPLVKFDDKFEVESIIQDWTSRKLNQGIVIFSAYAMGKAQELISIFNDAGIKPVVTKKISKISKVYVDNGIKLDYASEYDPESNYEEIVRDNFVGISETRNLYSLKEFLQTVHNKKVFTAMATGFAKRFSFRTDAQFPLSDHADFSQSVEYIEATSAKKVLTYGPNASSFAKNLCNDGYNAIPFNESVFSANPINNNK
ncbi:MAG: hypothetical protein ABR981_02750 [Candidatus Micrarchaeaceae archaeon]|jgi:Cft2 family RNA processing exonuclease